MYVLIVFSLHRLVNLLKVSHNCNVEIVPILPNTSTVSSISLVKILYYACAENSIYMKVCESPFTQAIFSAIYVALFFMQFVAQEVHLI